MDDNKAVELNQRIKNANEVLHEQINKIISKNPESLSYEEIQVLNARRSYLTNDQKRIFASVLVSEKQPKL